MLLCQQLSLFWLSSRMQKRCFLQRWPGWVHDSSRWVLCLCVGFITTNKPRLDMTNRNVNIYVDVVSSQSSTLRPSCCRYQGTNWQMLCSNWLSVEVPWLSHRTWWPKIRLPKPPTNITEKIKPPRPSPVKVIMQGCHVFVTCFFFFSDLSTLRICSVFQLNWSSSSRKACRPRTRPLPWHTWQH